MISRINSIERDGRALLALGLAGGVAGVTLGLLFGLHVGGLGDRFFRFAGEPGGFGGCGFFRDALLLGLFGLARGLGLVALGRKGLALGALRHDRGIIGPGLR